MSFLAANNKELLSAMLDELPSSIVLLDQQGRIVYVNRGWKAFGDAGGLDDPAYYVGRSYLRVCETASGEDAGFGRAVAGGIREIIQQQRSDFYLEYPCDTPDQKRWFAVQLRPLQLDDTPLVLVIHTDVTEKVLAEAQAHQAQVAREKARFVLDFLNKTAHDFRTPITALGLRLEIYQRTDDPQRREQALEQIRSYVAHLGDLVEQLEAMKTLYAPRPLTYEAIDLHTWLLSLQNLFQGMALEKDIRVSVQLEPPSYTVTIDPLQLGNALTEMVKNAILYTPPGGYILLESSRTDTHTVISVRDTGIGMAPEDKARVFDVFYKADAARRMDDGGLGVGLTIAKAVVEQHNGTLTVETEPGHGSVFHIRLPHEMPPPRSGMMYE